MQKQTLQKVLAAAMSVAVLGTCAAVTSFAADPDSETGLTLETLPKATFETYSPATGVVDVDIDDINTSLDSSKPTFALSSATAKAGEEVTIELTCSNNPGITAWKVDFAYDSNALELVSAAGEGEYATAMGSETLSANPYTLSWNNDVKDVDANGAMASLTFKVKEGIADGDYDVAISYDEKNVYSVVKDADGFETNVAFQTVNGTITVESEVEPATTMQPPTTTVEPPTTTVEPPTTTVEPPTTTVEPPTTSQPTTTKATDPSTTGKASTRGETSSSSSSGTTGTSTTTNTSAVQTGAATPAVVILLMLAAAVVGMVVYRKKIK